LSIALLSVVSIMSTTVQTCSVKNSWHKQFIRFKFHAILSSMMGFYTILPGDHNHSFVSVSTLYMLPSH
jgi:hypothetical protein